MSRPSTKIPRSCAVCGSPFTVVPSKSRVVTCSRRCGGLLRQSRRPLEQRFWLHVLKTGQCWLWTGVKTPQGYGMIRRPGDRRSTLASHISYEMHYGPIPDDTWVLHRCDNPPCVRPDHLFLGNRMDNVRDMWEKGRAHTVINTGHQLSAGERNGHARLTATQAREIRERHSNEDTTPRELASTYGIAVRTIYAVLKGETWRDV